MLYISLQNNNRNRPYAMNVCSEPKKELLALDNVWLELPWWLSLIHI